MIDLEKAIENVPKVYEAGREREWNDFWDDFQDYGNRENYFRGFTFWPDKAYRPKYPIAHKNFNGTELNGIFYWSAITDTRVDIDALNITQSALDCGYMFQNCYYLETVRKFKVKRGNTYTATFSGCKALKNITFSGEIGNNIDFKDSPLLSKASIKNIISVLVSDATDKALTLNKAAVNTAFETEEGLADGSASAQWAELVGTKPNWTISLI